MYIKLTSGTVCGGRGELTNVTAGTTLLAAMNLKERGVNHRLGHLTIGGESYLRQWGMSLRLIKFPS